MTALPVLRVGKNALALFLARVGTLLLGVWLTAQLARSAGPAGLGRYLLALTVEGIALAVVNLGLNTYATRELSRHPEGEAANSFLGQVLSVKVLAAVAGWGLLNGLILPLVFPGPRGAPVAVASAALLPESLNGGLIAVIKARQRMEISSLIELGARLVAAAGGIAALLRGGDETGVLLAYVAGQVLATAALGLVMWRWGVRPRAGLGRAWRARVGEALPFAGADVVAILYRRLDLMLLSFWRGDAAAGIYGAAYRLWETLGIVPASFLDALFPELARLGSGDAAQKRGDALARVYRRARRMLLGALLLIVLPGLVLAPQALGLLYGDLEGLPTAIQIFRVLLAASLFTYLYLLNGHLLYAAGAQRQVMMRMAGVTLLNGLLNLAAIPLFGVWGAAGVAFLSEAVLFVLLRSAAQQRVWR
ncbi:MAG: oligosaccharide flippase family protein [Anaerolineae bacterium]|nr:oligosaccharide flippase family protein [Anaerolineae bacterium]